MKIINDKYFTPKHTAKYIIDIVKEFIGDEITEYLEPSAGQGVFLDFLDKPYLAYDIDPQDNRIKRQDFLLLDLPYKKGRCIIGNPPYGNKNTLSVKFFKKSITLGDFLAFILPISQLNNNQQMFDFDLIHSEDLGRRFFVDRTVHCCFNIFKRPLNMLNKKPNYKIDGIVIEEVRQKTKIIENYDFAICGWGASIGKEIEYCGQYAKEFYITINAPLDKASIILELKNAKWGEIYNMTATPNLSQWQIYKYLMEKF